MRAVDSHLRHDWAFVTQPGRIIARERMNRRDERAHEIATKGGEMAVRAVGIDQQLERTIFSDDTDALERLRERIAGLEAQREAIKAFNAAIRKAKGDALIVARIVSAAPASIQASFLSVARHQAYYQPEIKGLPPYELSNLGGNISRNKERLAQLEREAAPDFEERPRLLTVKYAGTCRDCGYTFTRGETALYYRTAKELACYGEHKAEVRS